MIVFENLKAYFQKEFSPERLKWDRIVEDEKRGRNCPKCGRFGFYIHLPTSIREYWWGMYRCKGCKTEYRPKFTRGNLFFLLLMAFFYFNQYGKAGFTYKTYLNMAIGFAFAIGVNYVYSRMSTKTAKTATLLGGLGWLLAIAEVALGHHGEGVATGNPKDVLYLLGSTAGFTFAGGGLLGLIPGVQSSTEDLLRLFHERVVSKAVEMPPLVDETGKVLRSDQGKVLYNDQWVDREVAAQWIKERQEEIAKADEQSRKFWEDVEKDKEQARINRMNRLEQEGWVYDAEQDAMVPGPNHPDVIAGRRRQEAERLNEFIEKNVADTKRADFLENLVDRVSENGGDMERLRDAIMDNTVGAEQQLSMGDAESNLAEAEAWRESEEYAENVRNWSQRANRVIGKFVPGSGAVINILQNSMYNVVKGYDEGGGRGALTSLAASAVDSAISVYTGIPAGIGSAIRENWGTEYTRDKDGNFISPFDRLTSKVWHNFADQYDPRVFAERIENAKGIGDYFDISVDLLEARDDMKKFRENLGEIRDRDIQIDMETEPGGRQKIGAEEPAEGPSRRVRGDEEGPKGPKGLGEGEEAGALPRGKPSEAPEGGAGGAPPKGPNIPEDLREDYRNYQRALANGDEAAANRYATRMLVKNYDEFKGLVQTKDIDAEAARRAVDTHQQIIRDGVDQGIERTKRTGNLFVQDHIRIDENGNMTVIPSPIKRTWSAGGGMEEFNPSKGVPGDTDLTHIIDRDAAKARGLDPDQVQNIARGHTEDSINQIAKNRLGDDIGDYSRKTKIKHPVGSDEEYLSFESHKTPGTELDSTGGKRTTLGEEMGRSKRVDAEVHRTATGRAMQRADEHNMISRIIEERKPTGDMYRDGETAREAVKHLDRTSQYERAPDSPANWKPGDVDKSKLHSPEGFEKVLEAARTENPAKIKEAIDNDPNYKGDYNKFFQDVKESSKQGVQKSLSQGGKVWDAQTERLRADGIKIDKENVVQHTAKPETRGAYLERVTGEPDLSKLAPKKETFRTESAQKLYEEIKDQKPPQDAEGKITGFGNKPEPDVTNTREAAFGRDAEKSSGGPGGATPEQIEEQRFVDRLEEQRGKDPIFKDVDERVRKAINEGKDTRIADLSEDHSGRMMNEGKWGPPESPEFKEELRKRLAIDQRIEDPSTVKIQENYLVQEKVTREQFNAWLDARENLRSGKPVEPFKPFAPPDEKSWAPIKTGESAFRPDDDEILAGAPKGFAREEVLARGPEASLDPHQLGTGAGFSKKPPSFAD